MSEMFVLKKLFDAIINNEAIKKYSSAKASKSYESFKDHFGITFKEYQDRKREEGFYLNTVLDINVAPSFEQVYIPLKISTLNHYDKDSNNSIQYEEYTFGHFSDLELFIQKYKRVLIVDDAGMGKTMLSKWIFENSSYSKKLPVYVELRSLKEEDDLFSVIYNELIGFKGKINEDYVKEMLLKGEFIFIFDGLDEIANKIRSNIVKKIRHFIGKLPHNHFFLTSRAVDEIAGFRDFNKFSINNFKLAEAIELIDRFSTIKGNHKIKDLLVNELTGSYSFLEDFIKSPLMISMLYKVYEYKQVIPENKSKFYKQLFEVFYEKHDYGKGDLFIREKASALSKKEFFELTCGLGYISFVNAEKGFDEELGLKYLKELKEQLAINFDEIKYLKDLVESVPYLFIIGDEYVWKHKSFQEYFAAFYLNNLSQSKKALEYNNIYNKMINYELDNVDNFCEFCNEIDKSNFRKMFVSKFLQNIIGDFSHIPRDLGNEIAMNMLLLNTVVIRYIRKNSDIYIEDLEGERVRIRKIIEQQTGLKFVEGLESPIKPYDNLMYDFLSENNLKASAYRTLTIRARECDINIILLEKPIAKFLQRFSNSIFYLEFEPERFLKKEELDSINIETLEETNIDSEVEWQIINGYEDILNGKVSIEFILNIFLKLMPSVELISMESCLTELNEMIPQSI